MVTISIVRGDTYYAGKDKNPRNDYIRIMWSRGLIEMKKTCWDQLPKYKKDRIYSMQHKK